MLVHCIYEWTQIVVFLSSFIFYISCPLLCVFSVSFFLPPMFSCVPEAVSDCSPKHLSLFVCSTNSLRQQSLIEPHHVNETHTHTHIM